MLFKREFHRGLASGAITLTFRLWSRPQVKVGGRYRCHPIGLLEVDAIDRVTLGDISDAEAKKSGFDDRDSLLAYLRKSFRAPLTDETEVFRVELHFAGADDSPPLAFDTTLSPADLEELAARLEKMDRLSQHGAWTRETLSLIEKHPRVAASRLAPRVDREIRPFKADVRKLKKLGLTISHEVGYEISPRGRVFLKFLRK